MGRTRAADCPGGRACGRQLPAPGLIQVASLCCLSNLRLRPITTQALIEGLPFASRLAGLSAQARGRLVNARGEWWERHRIV